MTLPKIDTSILIAAALAVLGIYLFANAPADLEDDRGGGRTVPVETLFRLLNAENASIRKLYTADIVTPGLKNGLKYREDWKDKGVHAGPLPALVLRETANRLQQRVPDLSLFLGSTFPIEASNMFKGAQLGYFEKIDKNREPQFFLDESTGRYTAMFADIAGAPACVKCHNEHPKSPRKNWKLDDVMGATTWSFPRKEVSTDELVTILAAYRTAALDTYGAYLKKTESFAETERPQIGTRWPQDGLYLPDVDTFRASVETRNSTASLNTLLQASATPERVAAAKTAGKATASGAAKPVSASLGSKGSAP